MPSQAAGSISIFCPVCSSAIYGYVEYDPDVINITIGNFADPNFPPPTYALWNKYKHPWVDIPKTCKGYDRQPAPDDIEAD